MHRLVARRGWTSNPAAAFSDGERMRVAHCVRQNCINGRDCEKHYRSDIQTDLHNRYSRANANRESFGVEPRWSHCEGHACCGGLMFPQRIGAVYDNSMCPESGSVEDLKAENATAERVGLV